MEVQTASAPAPVAAPVVVASPQADIQAVADYFKTTASEPKAAPAKAAPQKQAAKAPDSVSEPEPSQPASTPEPDGEPHTAEPEDDTEAEAKPDAGKEPEAEELDADSEGTPEADEADSKGFDVPLPNGETRKVPLKELREGYLRQEDYSRKISEVTQQQKAATEASQKFQQERLTLLTALNERYQALNPVGILQARLQQAQEIGDNEMALQLRLDINDVQKQVDQTAKAQEWEQAREAETKQLEDQQYLYDQQQALFKKLPDLATDKGKRDKFSGYVTKAMQHLGYSQEEISSVKKPEHRNAMALHLAGKYLEQQAQRPVIAEAIKGKTVTAKPGARVQDAGSAKSASLRSFDNAADPVAGLAGMFRAFKV